MTDCTSSRRRGQPRAKCHREAPATPDASSTAGTCKHSFPRGRTGGTCKPGGTRHYPPREAGGWRASTPKASIHFPPARSHQRRQRHGTPDRTQQGWRSWCPQGHPSAGLPRRGPPQDTSNARPPHCDRPGTQSVATLRGLATTGAEARPHPPQLPTVFPARGLTVFPGLAPHEPHLVCTTPVRAVTQPPPPAAGPASRR